MEKQYSAEIIAAYDKWMQKAAEIPDSYKPDYPKRKRAETRAGDKFEKLCASQGLSYIKVAQDLIPNKI